MRTCTYGQLAARLGTDRRRVALLPVGCYEQHGPELPLETDSLVAARLCEDLADRLTDWVTHVFPTVHYTPTEPNRDFCGTVHVSNEVARAYLAEVYRGILRHPFDALVVVNGHGSVSPVLKEVGFAQVFPQFERAGPRQAVLCLDAFEFAPRITEAFDQAPGRHAEWTELLYTFHLLGPAYYDRARWERLQAFAAQPGFEDRQPAVLGIPMDRRSVDGVAGRVLPPDPRWEALPEQAERLWALLLDCLEEKLRRELNDFWNRFSGET